MKKIFSVIALSLICLLVKAADQPSFPGGDTAMKQYLKEHTVYPVNAKENDVEGIVVVGFMVSEDGTLKNLKIVKYVDPDLEKEALRVVGSMPAWIPAEKNGTPIEAPSKVEVPFILE